MQLTPIQKIHWPSGWKDRFWLAVFSTGSLTFLYLAFAHVLKKEWFMAKATQVTLPFVLINIVLFIFLAIDLIEYSRRRSPAALGRCLVWAGSLTSSLWGLADIQQRAWLMAFGYLLMSLGCGINAALLLGQPTAPSGKQTGLPT